jgi:hypothetical protein
MHPLSAERVNIPKSKRARCYSVFYPSTAQQRDCLKFWWRCLKKCLCRRRHRSLSLIFSSCSATSASNNVKSVLYKFHILFAWNDFYSCVNSAFLYTPSHGWHDTLIIFLCSPTDRGEKDSPRKILFQSAGVEPRNLLVFFSPQTIHTPGRNKKAPFVKPVCEEMSHAYVPLVHSLGWYQGQAQLLSADPPLLNRRSGVFSPVLLVFIYICMYVQKRPFIINAPVPLV